MEAGKLTIEIGNHLMEKWDVTEEDLYRLGMVNMSAKDSFYSDEMVGIIRKTAQTGLDEDYPGRFLPAGISGAGSWAAVPGAPSPKGNIA